MGTPRTADRLICERLTFDVEELVRRDGIIDQLAKINKEQATETDNAGARSKTNGHPLPWHVEAGPILMEIHAGARELENDMRYLLTRRTRARGGSDANTRAALVAVTNLAYAVPAEVAADAAERVAHWVRSARQIRDLDQADRWVPLPRDPGRMPPPCPYCDTYSLRMSRRAGEVRCIAPECCDDRGRRPVARMEIGQLSGDAYLAFADGREIVYRDE